MNDIRFLISRALSYILNVLLKIVFFFLFHSCNVFSHLSGDIYLFGEEFLCLYCYIPSFQFLLLFILVAISHVFLKCHVSSGCPLILKFDALNAESTDGWFCDMIGWGCFTGEQITISIWRHFLIGWSS